MIRPESYRQPPSLTSVRHASRWLTDSNERPAIRLRLSNVALPPGRRLARMVTPKKTPRRGWQPDISGAHRLGCHGPDRSVFSHRRGADPHSVVELTHTRSYIHGHARSANPVKGNLHERSSQPKP